MAQHIPAEHLDFFWSKAQFLKGFHMGAVMEDLHCLVIVQLGDFLLEHLQPAPGRLSQQGFFGPHILGPIFFSDLLPLVIPEIPAPLPDDPVGIHFWIQFFQLPPDEIDLPGPVLVGSQDRFPEFFWSGRFIDPAFFHKIRDFFLTHTNLPLIVNVYYYTIISRFCVKYFKSRFFCYPLFII